MTKCKSCGAELICPVCRGAAGGRIGGRARTEAKISAGRRNVEKARSAHHKAALAPKRVPLDRSEIWGKVDALAYFEKHPQDEVTAADLIRAASKPKKESAQRYAALSLFRLLKSGRVAKLRRGVYRLVNQPH